MSESNKQGIDVALQRALDLANSAVDFDPVKNIKQTSEIKSFNNDIMGKTALAGESSKNVPQGSKPEKAQPNFVDYRKNFVKEPLDVAKQSAEYTLRVAELIGVFREYKSSEGSGEKNS